MCKHTAMAKRWDKDEEEKAAAAIRYLQGKQVEAAYIANLRRLKGLANNIVDELKELRELAKLIDEQKALLPEDFDDGFLFIDDDAEDIVLTNLVKISEEVKRSRLFFVSRHINAMIECDIFDVATYMYRDLNFWEGFDFDFEKYGGIFEKPKEEIPLSHYDKLKLIVIKLNGILRKDDAAIAHPQTGEPSILYAVPSKDGDGRFTFESRITKKRTGFYKSLKELYPITLVPDVPRKEGAIERRKKKSVNDGSEGDE